jgi:hypothetical protein
MVNGLAEVAPTPALAPDIAVQTDSVLRITCPSLSDCSTKTWTLLLAVALKKPFLTKAFFTHLCPPSEITSGATHVARRRQ